MRKRIFDVHNNRHSQYANSEITEEDDRRLLRAQIESIFVIKIQELTDQIEFNTLLIEKLTDKLNHNQRLLHQKEQQLRSIKQSIQLAINTELDNRLQIINGRYKELEALVMQTMLHSSSREQIDLSRMQERMDLKLRELFKLNKQAIKQMFNLIANNQKIMLRTQQSVARILQRTNTFHQMICEQPNTITMQDTTTHSKVDKFDVQYHTIEKRLVETIMSKKWMTPLDVYRDQLGYLHKRNGAYLFDSDGNMFKCSETELERLIEKGYLALQF